MSRRPQRSRNLPSTPNKRSLVSQPSTTPLVPPPSYLTNKSTTPAGPPPESVFGSSLNPGNATFARKHGSALRSYTLPDSSPPQSQDGEDELPLDHDTQGDDLTMDDTALELFGRNSTLMSSIGASTRGLKRTRDGRIRTRKQSDLPAIAKTFATQRRKQRLPQADDIVLEIERLLADLSAAARHTGAEESGPLLASSVEQLTNFWRETYSPETKEGGIGLSDGDDTANASYIASFVLQLHHPHHTSAPAQSHGRRVPSTTLPQALLDWLNTCHNPFPDDFDGILASQPAPSSNESFWDVVYQSVLRGRFDRAITLLKRAAWEHAVTALDDGASQPGYSGHQLHNTQDCVEQCLRMLASSPAEQDSNWDIKDGEWSLFRQRVRTTLNDLQTFAGADTEADDAEEDNIFSRSVQGSFNFSRASKRAGSKVPWTILENLKLLYNLLLGEVDEVLMVAQDWLEASVYLTIWWDGNDADNGPIRSKSAIRREAQRTREVDITPLAAYRNRLADAFALAISEPDETGYSIDTTDATQVGLASAMEDNVSGVLSVLQSLSLPVAAAVADIAAFGHWLPGTAASSRELLEHGFDSQDLLVLSSGRGAGADLARVHIRDDILLRYAELLATRDRFQSHDGTVEREGWEIASSVYGRVDDQVVADHKIEELLDRVRLESSTQTDKVLQLCSDLGLISQARRVAERFADGLAGSGQDFGAILVFYARAHAFDKLDNTLMLLTSFCLVQSTAMPPQSKVDSQLRSLLSDRAELLTLSHSDPEAAAYLASKLSGYATARRFYDLRDSELNKQRGSSSIVHSQHRKRDAAKALLSLIASAADCIRGGLFDPEVQSVIAVDGLLVMLGEVIPLCRQNKRILASQDIFALLRVIEDFSTAPARIQQAAEDVLHACREASTSQKGGPPTLQSTRSDVSTHSGLSESSYELLMASSSMLSQPSQTRSTQAVERAWDWRKGLPGIQHDLNAQSILMMLRTLLAEELGKVWVEASTGV